MQKSNFFLFPFLTIPLGGSHPKSSMTGCPPESQAVSQDAGRVELSSGQDVELLSRSEWWARTAGRWQPSSAFRGHIPGIHMSVILLSMIQGPPAWPWPHHYLILRTGHRCTVGKEWRFPDSPNLLWLSLGKYPTFLRPFFFHL